MAKSHITIPYDELYGKFEKHLCAFGNERILFSGKYGTGKTHFLRDFFAANTDRFDVYHLYPVNYQITDNQDIVELISYDILVELLQLHPTIFTKKKPLTAKDRCLLFYEFFNSTYTTNDVLRKTVEYGTDAATIFESFLPVKLGSLGRPLKDLLALDKEFQTFLNEFQTDGRQKVDTFMKDMQSKESRLIDGWLRDTIAAVKGEKLSVLILDDLDRVDPAQLFRLLNVFSAFNEQAGGNKLGFDKVVLVGHQENIRHIFHHFYGPHTDFDGYIDKFYSHRIYEFSNSEIIAEQIKQIIHSLGTNGSGGVHLDFDEGYFVFEILHYILYESTFIKERHDMRQLLKLHTFSETILAECEYRAMDPFFDRPRQIIEAIRFSLRILLQVFGDKEKLVQVLKSLRTARMHRDSMPRHQPQFYARPLLLHTMGLDYDEVQTGDKYTWNGYHCEIYADVGLKIKGDVDGGKALLCDLLVDMLNRDDIQRDTRSD